MCDGQTVVIEIMNEAGIHMFFEKLHKMRRTIVAQMSHLGDGNRFIVMFLYVLYDKLELLQNLLFGGGECMTLAIRSQKKEELEQGTLQRS